MQRGQVARDKYHSTANCAVHCVFAHDDDDAPIMDDQLHGAARPSAHGRRHTGQEPAALGATVDAPCTRAQQQQQQPQQQRAAGGAEQPAAPPDAAAGGLAVPLPLDLASALPGGPHQPFVDRYKEMRAARSAAFDAFALVIILTSAGRHLQVSAATGSPMPPACALYLASYLLAAAACVAAFLAGGRWRAAYTRHLEATAAVLRLASFGLGFPDGSSALGGAGWQLTRRLLDLPATSPAAGDSGGLLREAARLGSHLMLLLFASGAPPLVHIALGRPTRLWMSALVQAALVAHCMAWAPHMCGAAQLGTPRAAGYTRRIYSALSPLGHVMLFPVDALAAAAGVPRNGAAECASLLRFFQLLLGTAPLVWQAATQAELFRAHQVQRAVAGLPPERGFSARLWGAIHGLLDPIIRPHLWLAAVVAVGLLWQIAVGSSPS